MIETKTLLIIGAGASVPYGYPTGSQLKDMLCDVNNSQSLKEYMLNILNMGGRKEVIEVFCQQFRASPDNSIDVFLGKRKGQYISKLINGVTVKCKLTYEDFGKLAIANQLIKCEKIDSLNPNDDNWLQYLWNHMNNDVIDDFKSNKLKIVTFNYDRVIEQYFQTAIESSYGVETEVATNLRESTIDIVHVYGSLQSLDERAYGAKSDNIGEVANSVRVISEAREEKDTEFKKAHAMIAWADKICFIGFGFDSTNLRRLGFPNHDCSDKTIYSTQFERTAYEISDAEKLLGKDFIDKHTSNKHLKTLACVRESGFSESSKLKEWV